MFQGKKKKKNTPEGRVQAFRSVDNGILPGAVPPATMEEVIHIETRFDSETQKEFVLWDDILQVFKKAEMVRHETKALSFLKGKDLTILQPRRIAAVPDTILDVIIDTPASDTKVPNTILDVVTDTPASDTKVPNTILDVAIDTPASNTKDTISDATSPVRRNPAYGHEDTAVSYYTHTDELPPPILARGQQAVLDDQARLAKDLPVPPQPDNGNCPHQRGPQSPTVSANRDLAQLGISASQGDGAAQIALGDKYRDGNGVPQDYQAAFDWYQQAAEQGNPIGQTRLGELYQYGDGVPQDYMQSLKWYHEAASRGSIRAQREIADFHYNGRGVPKDYVQAMVWYRKAADQGDAGSQCKVGSLYEYGGGVAQDHLKAAEWYQKAADQGHAFAKKCLRALKDKGMPDK